ncbi:MAG: hypothetical protein NVSMB5_09420 [Candidatus Velthaea sp.]
MWLVRTVVAVCLAFVASSISIADAHPLGNFTTNHLSRLSVKSGAVNLHYVLDMAEIPTVALQRSLAADGRPSAAQYAAWGKMHGIAILDQLDLRAGDVRVPLTLSGTSVATRPGAAGLQTIYFTADFRATLPAGTRALAYADRTESGRLGWKDAVLAPSTEPTRELRVYPNALIGSPRTRTTLNATIDATGVAHVAADAPDNAPAAAAPSAARSNALSELLARQNGGPLVLLGALLLAIALGALHALEPGHGKTLLAVSLVGARATASQALILASSLTVAHTIGVLVLGIIVLYATRWIVPEAIYPWITLLSGALVATVGARALAAAIRARRPRAHEHPHVHPQAQPHAHEHAHGLGAGEHHGHADHVHDRDHAHGHSHDHGHPHAHDLVHAHGAHDHAGLDDEAHARAHAIPGTAPLTFRTAVLAAATGNIAPCPAALVVLLAAISLHQIAFGLGLIVAFSIGLAATLTTLGIAVVRGAAWLSGRPQFDRVAKFAPLLSAGVIAVIGAVMVGEGMVAQGVPAPVPILAALTLLAIAGYAFMLPHRHSTVGSVHA